MTEINVRTEESYGDEFIDSVQISQGGVTVDIPLSKDKILVISESGDYEYVDYKSRKSKVYLKEGCRLNVEVDTPEPHISVEVSNEDIQDKSSGYAYWVFNRERGFEQWVDKNDIELCER